jgi:hypothetical protein
MLCNVVDLNNCPLCKKKNFCCIGRYPVPLVYSDLFALRNFMTELVPVMKSFFLHIYYLNLVFILLLHTLIF